MGWAVLPRVSHLSGSPKGHSALEVVRRSGRFGKGRAFQKQDRRLPVDQGQNPNGTGRATHRGPQERRACRRGPGAGQGCNNTLVTVPVVDADPDRLAGQQKPETVVPPDLLERGHVHQLFRRERIGFPDGSEIIVGAEVGENLYLAARNLHKVDVRDVDAVDPVSLIAYDKVMVTVDAVKKFEEMLG